MGCIRFQSPELGPLARAADTDRAEIAALFEKLDCTLLGPPLTAD